MIRRDIFAVKELDPSLSPDWCFVRMTKDRAQANRYANDILRNHSLGIRRQAKIVHPTQFVVNAFVAAGNIIEE